MAELVTTRQAQLGVMDMISKINSAGAVAILAFTAALVSASASNAATITGGGPFTSSSPGGLRIVVTSNPAPVINCTSTSASGATNNGTYTTFPAVVGDVTLHMTGCTGPLGLAVNIACLNRNLSITANPVSGVTAGSLLVSCTVTYPAIPCSGVIAGTVPISYTNPAGGVNGRLTLGATAQSLSVMSSTCSVTILANGASADVGAPGATPLALGNRTYTQTSTGPTIS